LLNVTLFAALFFDVLSALPLAMNISPMARQNVRLRLNEKYLLVRIGFAPSLSVGLVVDIAPAAYFCTTAT
jgi:hypothetical protein